MRPIWVTTLTLMAGAFAILFDPIFEGMAISLLFGPIIAVPLTMLVVPLGCVSACKAFITPKKEDDSTLQDIEDGEACEFVEKP
jgi:hypothetical protein